MKKIIVYLLILCLCCTVFCGSGFAEAPAAETTQAEAPAAEAPKAEMTADAAGYEPDEADREHLKAVLGEDYTQK